VFPPVQPLRSAVGGNDSLVRLNAVTLVKSHVLEHAEPHPNYDVNDVRSLTESHNKHIYWHIMASVDLKESNIAEKYLIPSTALSITLL